MEFGHRLNVTKVMCLRVWVGSEITLRPSDPEEPKGDKDSMIEGIGNWPEIR